MDHLLLLKILLLFPSNSCHHQGGNTLHSADAVTVRALVVLNRRKKPHGVRDFLFEDVGFVWFFWNAAGGKQAGSGGWQPTSGRGRELSLVLNPRPLQGPPPPPRAWVPCVTGEKDQGRRGNKSQSTLPATGSFQ